MADLEADRLKRLQKYTVQMLQKHWLGLCEDGAVLPSGKRALVRALVILEQRAGTVGGRGHG